MLQYLGVRINSNVKNKGEDCGWKSGIGKLQRMVKKIPNKMGGKYD